MKKSAEKIGSLLNYEKLSNIRLLELPKIEKKDIPSFINCPKYEKAKGKLDTKMERFNTKVSRLTSEISSMKTNIAEMSYRLTPLRDRMNTLKSYQSAWDSGDVNKYNGLVAAHNDILDQTRKLSEKHDDTINKKIEAEEEAKEALEELTDEALQTIDEDIPMVFNRLEGIASNFADSGEADDVLAAIDVCFIALRIYSMFEDLIDDNNARKECKEGIAKINQIFSNLCAKDSIQNYMLDIYQRNLDLMQKNAAIAQQIDGVLASVDQKQLDTLIQSINVVPEQKFDTNFSYNEINDPVVIDAIIVKIKKTIDALNQSIAKAKETEAAAVDFAKAGVNANQQAKTLRTSMQSNVEAFEEPLMKSHIAVQMIEEAVIENFYQKDLRVVATTLRKHLVDTIGEKSFEDILKGGDDLFSLKKAQDAINKANLVRLQTALDKVPDYVKKLTEQISSAELDIQKANEVHRNNAEALNAELRDKYIRACLPVIGFVPAFVILERVKAFESAFRSTNQVYRDLGNTLLEKNKKMITVIMIIGAILGFGGMIAFFVLNLSDSIAVNAGVPGAILLLYVITILGLTAVGKRLSSYLGISAGE